MLMACEPDGDLFAIVRGYNSSIKRFTGVRGMSSEPNLRHQKGFAYAIYAELKKKFLK